MMERTFGEMLQVAEQLGSTAKYGWTPLHAAARGNNEAIGALMTTLVNYLEADEVSRSWALGGEGGRVPGLGRWWQGRGAGSACLSVLSLS